VVSWFLAYRTILKLSGKGSKLKRNQETKETRKPKKPGNHYYKKKLLL